MAKKASGINKEVHLSKDLAEFMGSDTATRAEITLAIWAHIKANDLQDSKDKRVICPDEVLAPILGKAKISMFKMQTKINAHVVSQ